MPEKKTIERAKQAKREGKAPTTQAGAFVREEMEHIREGKHGAKNPKQAIAIGLSKARRAGVQLPPPGSRSTSASGEGSGEKKRPARRRTSQTKRGAKATTRKSTAKRARGATKRPSRTSPKSRATKRAPRSSATSRTTPRQGRKPTGRRKRTAGSSRSRTKRASA